MRDLSIIVAFSRDHSVIVVTTLRLLMIFCKLDFPSHRNTSGLFYIFSPRPLDIFKIQRKLDKVFFIPVVFLSGWILHTV